MSMNLHVAGVRTATVMVKGQPKTIPDRTDFDLWQTPTEVTRRILAHPTFGEQHAAYADWVRNQPCLREDLPVYAPEDIFGDGPPIGTRRYDPAEEHLASLATWLHGCADEDFEVSFYEM